MKNWDNFEQYRVSLKEQISITAEITGSYLSGAAAEVMAERLIGYDPNMVAKALMRCQVELKSKLTLGEIISRLDYGYPPAEEVYGLLVEGWRDEALTVVVPKLAMECATSAYNLYREGDKYGSRTAFIAAYEEAVRKAAESGIKPEWMVSPGSDKSHLEATVMAAYDKGWLSRKAVAGYLPSNADKSREAMRLLPNIVSDEQAAKNRVRITEMLAELAAKKNASNLAAQN